MALVRRLERSGGRYEVDELLGREWLVTNGLGGYASGSVAGVPTRRYHGVLVAALPGPLGRMVMLNHVGETLVDEEGGRVPLSTIELTGGLAEPEAPACLEEFAVEDGLPVWRFRHHDLVVEKRLLMPHRQNTTHVFYRLAAGGWRSTLELRLFVHIRPHEGGVSERLDTSYTLTAFEDQFELSAPDLPALRLTAGEGANFAVESREIADVLYRVEQARGYPAGGALHSPGFFTLRLERGGTASLTASTESWETIHALLPGDALKAEGRRRGRLVAQADPRARGGFARELVYAADQFVIQPAGRAAEAVRAHAEGDAVRTVVAGYPWFTDWGRDTMIALEGLTIVTGRSVQAGYILRTFGRYLRDGLIPNLFPEGQREGLYHTADATLWFFHAIDRYLDATGDRETLRNLLPDLRRSVDWHVQGTHFGIKVDPSDGLLTQGAEGYQLTWMDAKVDDWVVTPRRGKAVEINALWYNALRLLEGWLRQEDGETAAAPLAEQAGQARASFNRRFWYEQGRHLYDVVDGEQGDDGSCRPNQVLAIALPHPILDRGRWASVLEAVERELLTPCGLRSLAPGERDYKAQYYGDLRARDAAYHQGTVWAWLIGPFVDAWLKLHPGDRQGARRFLESFPDAIGRFAIGTIAEIFDAEPPFTPRGCVAQAWSVAEVLRAWLKTSPDA
ncbi:MAG: glycogen debranching enzyme family protein [Acidobacteria bacterium]|nr:glycogen debranching enzyme family protein [Acidobacteriota bacterium]